MSYQLVIQNWLWDDRYIPANWLISNSSGCTISTSWPFLGCYDSNNCRICFGVFVTKKMLKRRKREAWHGTAVSCKRYQQDQRDGSVDLADTILTLSDISGTSSNRWTSLFILIANGNLYQVLAATALLSCIMSKKLPEVIIKHNLKLSSFSKQKITACVTGSKGKA